MCEQPLFAAQQAQQLDYLHEDAPGHWHDFDKVVRHAANRPGQFKQSVHDFVKNVYDLNDVRRSLVGLLRIPLDWCVHRICLARFHF